MSHSIKPHHCAPGSNHETFRLLVHQFCITTALELIEADEASSVAARGQVDVVELCKMIRLLQPQGMASLIAIDVRPEYAMTTDLSKPVLLAPLLLDGGGTAGNALIDGWHRVYKAHAEGLATLDCILLSEQAARAARTPVFL